MTLLEPEDFLRRLYKLKISVHPIMPMPSTNPRYHSYVYGMLDVHNKTIHLNSENDMRTNVDTTVHEMMHEFFDYELGVGDVIGDGVGHEVFIERARKAYCRTYPRIKKHVCEYIRDSYESQN